MIEIVSEKVVRPSRLFLTCSYHQRWGSQPVLTQPVLTDTMCTHAHRTLAAVHPPSDTPPSTARTSGTKQTRQASVLRVLLAAPPACVDGSSPHAVTAARPPAPDTHPQPRAPAHRSAVQPAAVAQTPIAAVRIEQFPDVLRSLAQRVVLKNTSCCGHHGCKAASCMAFCTARAAWRTALAAAQTAAPSSAVK